MALRLPDVPPTAAMNCTRELQMVYLPPHFEESNVESFISSIRDHPLGTLITLDSTGINANHIPFIFDPLHGEHGRLLGHVARNNSVWHDHAEEVESLVIFQSANAYISPNWYPTKQATHEVVPTWNYAVFHVYGNLIVHDDIKWVRGQAGMLTKQQESTQPIPWKMADAPPAYTEMMLGNIVGIEISITRVIGKLKASQNRAEQDRLGAIAGLQQRADPTGQAMAEIMTEINNRQSSR